MSSCADVVGLSDYYIDAQSSSTATTSAAQGGGTSSVGGGGSAPCEPTSEVCNGLDDDCDGVADEPEGGSGLACGCEWLTFNEQLFVACPTSEGPPFMDCPAGTQPFVPQSTKEYDAVKTFLPNNNDRAYVGLQQAAGSCDVAANWTWVRTGIPIPWADSEPNDLLSTFPAWVESGAENCGSFVRPSGENQNWLHDVPCNGFAELFLCEQIVDECVNGAPCLLQQGCQGQSDCSLPTEQRCVAAPTTDTCNGLDDDCNGTVDDGACGCSDTDGPDGKVYRFCGLSVSTRNTHCGEGFCPAKIDNTETLSFVRTLSNTGNYVRFGGYQSTNATLVDEAWMNADGSPFESSLWAPDQPDDIDGLEEHKQDCAAYNANEPTVRDLACATELPYLCESQ